MFSVVNYLRSRQCVRSLPAAIAEIPAGTPA